MSNIDFQRLNFIRAPGDTLITNQITLDRNGPPYQITMRYQMVAETWLLDLATTSGVVIVSGAWVRDRTDCLLGVSTPGRPNGAIMSYDPKGRGDPTLDSYFANGVLLLYVPLGLNPADFDAYTSNVT
jgi:hypothetical protein